MCTGGPPASLDFVSGPLYNLPVHRGSESVEAADVPSEIGHPKVLPFEWMNAARPVTGNVAHEADLTIFDFDVHHTFEVGILLAGQEERHFERTVRLYGVGDAWWTPAWEPHGWRTTVPPTSEIVIHFIPELLGDSLIGGVSWLSFFALPPESRPIIANSSTRRRVLAIGHELAEEFAAERLAWVDMVRCSLLRLLTLFARESGLPHSDVRWRGPHPSGLERILPAIDLVHAEFDTRLPLAAAAKACGLSPSWFRRIFKENTGMTYARFERRARLGKAARILLGSSQSVESVANQTGFADGSHFIVAFTKHYGCTPDEFRRLSRRTRPGSSEESSSDEAGGPEQQLPAER